MELYREERLAFVADAFAGAVVEVYEIGFPFGIERGGVHGVTVVLRRDDGTVRTDHQRRLVMAAVSVFQFEGGRSGGDRQQLVAQADAEDRLAERNRLFDVGDRGPALLRVSGAVRQHHPVVFELREIVVPRYADHRRVAVAQAADDVVLATAVDQYDPVPTVTVSLRLFRADLRDEIFAVRIDELLRLGRSFYEHLAEHHAAFADDLGDLPRIDAANGRNVVVGEPFAEAFDRVPMAVLERVVGDDQTPDVDTVRFEESEHPVFFGKLRNAVIAHQRVGNHQNLAAVRGIC